MKWLFSSVLTIAGLSVLAIYFNAKRTAPHVYHTVAAKKAHTEKEELVRLQSYGTSLETYARAGNYNTRYCFLADMRRPSGNNRFFVYDMKKDSVLEAGLVAHGSGTVNDSDSTRFSNEPGSYCTSLGRYSIGKSYMGTFGLAYKLYGLDKTNSKAFDRFVVLHGHHCVPDAEVAPENICRSWGCPTVAPAFLKKLAGYIDKSERPILLWVFK